MSIPTVSPEYIWRGQWDPRYSDTDGALVSAPLEIFYQKDINLGDGSPLQTVSSEPSKLVVDIVANATKTVTTNGKTYTYAEFVDVFAAIAAQERAASLAK